MRMMRRRSVVGAAVAVGAVSGARRNRAERKAIEQQTDANAQAASAEPQQAAPQDDLTAQLEQLNDLKNKGILTQSEFDAKKKQLLGI
jgi:membrane protease subunit (stomatin/prohibitin family)